MPRESSPRDQDTSAPSAKVVRALKALSQCSQVLVRAQDERELLVRVCEICTEIAGYRLAWVGLAEQDEAKTVRPVAQAGFEEGYLETVKVTWADRDRGRGPAGTAVRTGTPCVIRDTGVDPRFAPWRDEALRRGYASCVGLPLVADGATLGALTIYAPDKDAFDDDEMAMLCELADSLAYGVAALRTRAARDAAEAMLRRSHEELERRVEERTRELAASEARYRALVESSQDAIFQLDRNARISFVNTAGARSLGMDPRDVLGRSLAEIFPRDSAEPLVSNVHSVLAEGRVLTTEQPLHAAGRLVEYSTVLAPVFDAEGRAASVVGIARDVTRRKRAEEALRQSEARHRRLLENLPNLVLVVDPQSIIQYANHPVPGATVEQLIGSTGFGHMVPEYQDLCRTALGAALATGQVQAEAALKREQQGLRQLLDVYERHRRLIAYEIHDGVAQPLAGALMTLEGTLARLQAECAAATREGFARVAGLLREGMAEARRLMDGLGPPLLDESGLPAAVEYLVYEARKDWGVDIDCSIQVGFDRLASPLETAAFRIVQEGLANAGRHSRSPTIRVALIQREDCLRIEVEDHGAGFDPEAVDPGRYGLQGIRQRARLLGGSATIDSAPGRGARLIVELPLIKADVAATGGSGVEY